MPETPRPDLLSYVDLLSYAEARLPHAAPQPDPVRALRYRLEDYLRRPAASRCGCGTPKALAEIACGLLAEVDRQRARVAELIRQRDHIAMDTIRAIFAADSPDDAAEQAAADEDGGGTDSAVPTAEEDPR